MLDKFDSWFDYMYYMYNNEKKNEEDVFNKKNINILTSYDKYFMQLAKITAQRSQDPNTKVGACIVKDNNVLSLGYNSTPKNFNFIIPKENSTSLKNSKNTYMCHAEINAILNYKGNISDFNNSIIYVTHSPCHECAKILVQAGIKKVYYDIEYHNTEIWNISKFILDECGIEYKQLKYGY